MSISTDPDRIPAARGWEVLPVFRPREFSKDYLKALEDLEKDTELRGHSDVGVRNLLFVLILSLKPERVLEIGGHIGSGTLVMAEALRLNGFGRLITLEPEDHFHARLSHYVEKARFSQIVDPVKALSTDQELQARFKREGLFDLVFVDACHGFATAKRDIVIAFDHLAENGIIVLHDTSHYAQSFDETKEGGVRRALIEASTEKLDLHALFLEYPFWLNDCGAALAIKQRISSDAPTP